MTLELIAEISGNHGGKLENALKLIDEAAEAGATGVKFQCFDADRLGRRRASHHRIKAIDWHGKPEDFDETTVTPALVSIYRDTHTPVAWFKPMIERATVGWGLTWHASVFDVLDIAVMERLECPRYKIASFEAFDDNIRNVVVRTGKPFIVSVNQNEVVPWELSHGWSGDVDVTVLHATDYKLSAESAGLARLRQWPRLVAKWGLSDHTTDITTVGVAVALGACMVEWHIRLPDVSTPDDAFSLTPSLFQAFAIRAQRIYKVMNGDAG